MSTELQSRKPFRPYPAGSFPYRLQQLINSHGIEAGSDTSDIILARYLMSCLENFDTCVRERDGKTVPDNNKMLYDKKVYSDYMQEFYTGIDKDKCIEDIIESIEKYKQNPLGSVTSVSFMNKNSDMLGLDFTYKELNHHGMPEVLRKLVTEKMEKAIYYWSLRRVIQEKESS